MLNRIRPYTTYRPLPFTVPYSTAYHRASIDPGCPPMADSKTSGLLEGLEIAEYGDGSISDEVWPKLKGYTKPAGFRVNRIPRPVKRVVHTRRRILNICKDVVSFEWYSEIGACQDQYGRICAATPLQFACHRWGPQWVIDNVVKNAPATTTYTSAGADWFSMMSEFNEKLDSLIPSDFLSGEMFLEGGIFIDAIRATINPKKALRGLLKDFKARRLDKLRLSVGGTQEYYRRVLVGKRHGVTRQELERLADGMGIPLLEVKDAINAELLYKFGVKPAIKETKELIDLNFTVQRQLDFLGRNRGLYVPIRVRTVSGDQPQGAYVPNNTYVDMDLHFARERCVNVLFAQGKVRTDINEASRWRAYAEALGLNKVVGVAWELIPFSFVVDWVTNAQERINDLTRIRLGEGPFVNLASVGSSVKMAKTYHGLILPGFDQGLGLSLGVPGEPVRAFDVEVSSYERMPGIPDTSGVVDVSTLGLFHGITFGELLYQKLF